jgi:hypothetical protein
MKFISHYLKNTPNAIALSNNICVFLVPQSKHASSSATHIGTLVLLTQQHEVRNRRRLHCKFPISNPTNSSGWARLSNHPHNPEVTAGKLKGNWHPLGWRNFGTSGTHCLRCIVCYDRPRDRRWSHTISKPNTPLVGSRQHWGHSGPDQRSATHLGGRGSDLPYIHFRAESIKKADHHCFWTNVP